MSTVVQYLPYVNIGASISSFFVKKNALSEKDAIEVRSAEWRSMGIETLTSTKSLTRKYQYIKEINGKYWLDEEILERYYKRRITAFSLIYLFLMIGVLGTVIFVFYALSLQ